MMDTGIRAELMRFRVEQLRRAAEKHHRTTRRTKSPRRPGPGHDPTEH